MSNSISPEKILNVGLGFWTSKTLLSAIELGLFTQLAEGPLSAESIQDRLKLHPRSARDFLDALVALGFLERQDGHYRNSPESELFLDKKKTTYIGGILEMANARLYQFWGSLTEALRSGEPQNEVKQGGELFEVLYADPQRLKSFLQGMTGLSRLGGRAIAAKFPWDRYKYFVDVGAAQGGVPVELALAHPHLSGAGFDLPVVGPCFEEFIASQGLADRLKFIPGNFMKDPLPRAEVLVMGHILHDWDLAQKKMLLAKAYEALPPGGALIVHEALIDDDRSRNAFGLLMSLNMLIETPGGFDFSGADCIGWMKEVGFQEAYVEALGGPDGMVVGIKR
ncbi:MAG TPA: methyltransferase [bacterium]|nr:methyltransferase [bacterium]